jgi:menaquinone-dependent protoporphyrinogen oxidase
MRVLIVPASRFGGTAEIGRAMAKTLRAEGLDVDVSQPDQMFNLSPYGAHIVGSSLYFGDWLDSAVTFVEEHTSEIRTKPTWLFSSGPFGPGTPDEPVRGEVVERLMSITGAVDHHLFGGRLELDRLPTRERFMAGWVGAQNSDLRDWDEIEQWTKGIAATLTDSPPEQGTGS